MSTERKAKSIGEALLSPEAGLYIAGIMISSVLGYLLCSGQMVAGKENRSQVTFWYIIVLVVSWIGVSFRRYEEDRSALPIFMFIFSIALAPIGVMFFGLTSGLRAVAFWAVLFTWAIAVLGCVLSIAETNDRWGKLNLALGAIWATFTIIISLGLNPWLPYASGPTKGFRNLHALLDLRYLSAIVFGVAMVGISLARVLSEDLVRPVDLPKYQAESTASASSSLLAVIASPFIAVFNVILLVAHMVLNLIWKLLYITAIFFIRLGRQVGVVIGEVLSERKVLWLIAKLLGVFVLCSLLTILAKLAEEPVLRYLMETSWGSQVVPLFKAVVLTVLMAIVIIGVLSLVRAIDSPPLLGSEVEEALQASALGIATILSNTLVSAGVLLAVSRIWPQDIQGFGRPGILSILLVILVAGGILKLLLTSGLKRES